MPFDRRRSSPSNRQNAFTFVPRTIVNYERTGDRIEDRLVEIGRVRRAEDESDERCSNDDTRTMTKRLRNDFDFDFRKANERFRSPTCRITRCTRSRTPGRDTERPSPGASVSGQPAPPPPNPKPPRSVEKPDSRSSLFTVKNPAPVG